MTISAQWLGCVSFLINLNIAHHFYFLSLSLLISFCVITFSISFSLPNSQSILQYVNLICTSLSSSSSSLLSLYLSHSISISLTLSLYLSSVTSLFVTVCPLSLSFAKSDYRLPSLHARHDTMPTYKKEEVVVS